MFINCMHQTVDYLNEIFTIDEKEFFKIPNNENGKFENVLGHF